MQTFRTGWYLLYTRPKREKKVADQLLDRGVKYFLPTLSHVRQWADRIKVIREPMFPSYVFVYLEQLGDYFTGLHLDGVLQYVKFGGQVARIPGTVIQNLELMTEYGKDVEVSSTPFRAGELLTISEGPFVGMQGEMVRYKNKDKIMVRLNVLQRCVLMQIPMNQVVKI